MEREEDVTGPALRKLRHQQGKSLEEFWGEVLVKRNTGYYYEQERSQLPASLRRLCFMHFVMGTNLNTNWQKDNEQ